MSDDRTDIARRMETMATRANQLEQGHPDLIRDPLQPRWRIDAKVVEFQCGCRAERCLQLFGAQPWDPVIFRDTRQQAVYDHVCARHLAGMNTIVHFGKFGDFEQWKRARRATLMGKVRP